MPDAAYCVPTKMCVFKEIMPRKVFHRLVWCYREEGRTALSGGRYKKPHPQPLPEVSGRGENTKFEGEKMIIFSKKTLPPFSVALPRRITILIIEQMSEKSSYKMV